MGGELRNSIIFECNCDFISLLLVICYGRLVSVAKNLLNVNVTSSLIHILRLTQASWSRSSTRTSPLPDLYPPSPPPTLTSFVPTTVPPAGKWQELETGKVKRAGLKRRCPPWRRDWPSCIQSGLSAPRGRGQSSSLSCFATILGYH